MRIALTYTGSDEKHNHYVQWLKGDDDLSIIKVSAGDNNLHELAGCDALVLTGGVDLHPELYHQSTQYENAPQTFNIARDAFETAAFKWALENNIPVLGICRGLQLINCVFGGSLVQDLGEDLNKMHKAGEWDKAHGLTIVTDTLLHKLIDVKRSVVNSAHHQAIKKLGADLKINCRADDGTIEGFEWSDPLNKPFLLCVQWHPERMFQFQLEDAPLSKMIRTYFIEEVQKSTIAK